MYFTDLENKVLNRVQRDFPLVTDPFSAMALEIDVGDDEFLTAARSLKERGIIRNISGIFNVDRLGFVSVLVAFQIGDDNIDNAARIINNHPGVSHNYLREHRFNMWFSLAAESVEKLERAVRYLSIKTNAADYLLLKNERTFKIGLILNFGNADSPENGHFTRATRSGARLPKPLTREEKDSIRVLQYDLPLETNPFTRLRHDNKVFFDEESLLAYAVSFKEKGIMRRYAAVLRHQKAGFTANAMTVWKPAGGADLERIARIFFARTAISHLYLRSISPGKWEYPLFAMIHARSGNELDDVIRGLSLESGVADYQVLRTLREFKKERVVYFSPKFEEWERQAGI